jgi:hypothetical protein
MASTFSTDLKLELMATGEKSGLWGDITNTNLTILQQAIAGYEAISIAGGAQTTALTFSNGLVSNGKNAVIKFTGTITGNQVVTIPDGIEKTYIIENGTTGTFTVQFKTVSGTGVTFATTDKSTKILFSDGTNIVDTGTVSLTGIQTLTNKTLTSPTITSPTITDPIINEINDSNGNELVNFSTTASAVNEITVKNAATTAAPEISATGTDTNIDLKLTPKGSGNLVLDGIEFPNADGTAGQVLATDGSGILSFVDGDSTAVVTSDVYDTGTAATWTKPASASFVEMRIWGGGGSGGKASSGNSAGGGGGGACNLLIFPFSALSGATVTYTVGAGAVGRTATNSDGLVGGTSSVTISDFNGTGSKTFESFGGGGGKRALSDGSQIDPGGGGGGGGVLTAGATGNVQTGGSGGQPIQTSYGGATGGRAQFNASNDGSGGSSYFGGAGGGGGLRGSTNPVGNGVNQRGGSSYFGGAGGGGAVSAGTAGFAGTSFFGGAGSAGKSGSTASDAGSVPGGGSGGTVTGNSGAGGGGRVQFLYW